MPLPWKNNTNDQYELDIFPGTALNELSLSRGTDVAAVEE